MLILNLALNDVNERIKRVDKKRERQTERDRQKERKIQRKR